jgi:hypothetical protein
VKHPLLVLGALTSLLALCACGRDPYAHTSNPARAKEDAIKARSVRALATEGTARVGSERPVLSSREEAIIHDVVALEVLADGSLLLMDNLNSRLFRAVFTTSTPTVEPWSRADGTLRYPHALRVDNDVVHVWDGHGLATLNMKGEVVRRARAFVGAHDFVLADDGFLINPSDRRDGSPLVLKVDAAMRPVASWGHKASGVIADARARAWLGRLGPRVIAGFVHQPLVRIFDQHSWADVEPEFPGLEELTRLEGQLEVVNPTRGVVRLPTYIAGICTVRNRAYILLDLPLIYILEVGPSGVVEGRYLGRSTTEGRHYSRLVGMATRDSLAFFSLAFDRDGTRSIVTFSIPGPAA